MRPIITFNRTAGAVMWIYALAVLLTSDNGTVHYLTGRTFLTPALMAGAFAVCGGLIFFTRPIPQVVGLLTTPILLFAIATGFYFAGSAQFVMPGTIAHTGLWFIIQAALIEKARGD